MSVVQASLCGIVPLTTTDGAHLTALLLEWHQRQQPRGGAQRPVLAHSIRINRHLFRSAPELNRRLNKYSVGAVFDDATPLAGVVVQSCKWMDWTAEMSGSIRRLRATRGWDLRQMTRFVVVAADVDKEGS